MKSDKTEQDGLKDQMGIPTLEFEQESFERRVLNEEPSKIETDEFLI